MTDLQALILGLIQGLTEFLPVSSSGHLELGSYFLNVNGAGSLNFTVVVHTATVLSTIVVFHKDILQLAKGALKLKYNEESQYILRILISALPIAFVGLFLKNHVESLFTGNNLIVGISLIITAVLLSFAHYSKGNQAGKISYAHGFIMGIAQALAVVPGISRSGATIATGLLLKNDRKEVARFSFLMVLIPIIGAFTLSFLEGDFKNEVSIGITPMLIGFVSAFISGLIACKVMIKLVTRGNLIYFAIYCLIIALIAIFAG